MQTGENRSPFLKGERGILERHMLNAIKDIVMATDLIKKAGSSEPACRDFINLPG